MKRSGGIAAMGYLLQHLEISIKRERFQLKPSQQIKFLSIEINSASLKFQYPERKLIPLQHECRRLLNKSSVSLVELRCIVCKIQDSTKALRQFCIYLSC